MDSNRKIESNLGFYFRWNEFVTNRKKNNRLFFGAFLAAFAFLFLFGFDTLNK
jgi:hypothetical protein